MKSNKGITLTSLIITIIIMVILVGIVFLFIETENGVVERANEAKKRSELAEFKENLSMEYISVKNGEENKNKTTKDKFSLVKEKMGFDTEFIGSGGMIINYDENIYLTLLEDGTIIDGKKIILSIEDGNIDILSNGYKQNNGELVEYSGDYIITGNTDVYSVKVWEKGDYNITIKDLYIDLSVNTGYPLRLNAGNVKTDLNVKLNVEGENYLRGSGSGIHFSGATPNINGVINGSTLTIEGAGSVYAEGGAWSAGIGNGYTEGNVANIIINSGNITAVGGSNGCGIGGGLRANVSNIIINGGNITAKTSNRYGVGATGILDNLVINGGNITAIGAEYGGAIGGGKGSGKIVINGGTIDAKHTINHSWDDSNIADGSNELVINGGVINSYSSYGMGVGNIGELPFKLSINGGKLIIDDRICSTPVNLVKGDLYQVKLKIEGLSGNSKITDIKTNNNIEYEVENLYTSRDGHLYMFLPEGEVEVSVTASGQNYKGTVTVTPENTKAFNLSLIE